MVDDETAGTPREEVGDVKISPHELPRDLLIRILCAGMTDFLIWCLRSGDFETVRFPNAGNIVEAVFDNRAQLLDSEGRPWLDVPISFGAAEALAILLGLTEDDLTSASGKPLTVRARMSDTSAAM